MIQWVVYRHPSDHPGKWVARKWLVQPGVITATDDMFTAETLAEIRELLPPGLACLAAVPGDHPVIFEVWL